MKSSSQADIVLSDEYFAHYIPNTDYAKDPHHVIFVFDVCQQTLQQTKDAMVTILDSLSHQDYVSIISFDGRIHHWPLDKRPAHVMTHREMAIEHARNLKKTGWGNINDALLAALEIAETVRSNNMIVPTTKQFIIKLHN